MPSTIGKGKIFSIKHTTLLEGKLFSGGKYKIAFFKIKCTFFGRKENTINVTNLLVRDKLMSNRHNHDHANCAKNSRDRVGTPSHWVF